MNVLILPAKKIMDTLRYKVKFTLIFFIVLVPILFLSINMVKDINNDINFLTSERLGLDYIKSIQPPMKLIQEHRGMTAVYLNTPSSELFTKIKQKRRDIDQKLIELQQTNTQTGKQLGFGDVISPLSQQWAVIKADSLTMPASKAIGLHSDLLADILDLLKKVADASEITLDPELDSYYLGAVLVDSFPQMLENMGQTRAIGSNIASNRAFSSTAQKIKLAVLSSSVSINFQNIKTSLLAVFKENIQIKKQLSAQTNKNIDGITAIQTLINNELLQTDTITVSGETVFNKVTTVINHSYQLYNDLIPVLDDLLTNRIKEKNTTLAITVAIATFVVLLVAYLFIGFYLSVQESISQINKVTHAFSKGDLSSRMTVDSNDEMKDIADHFNIMADNVTQIIQGVLNSAEELGHTSQELTISSKQTNENINKQKIQTELIAAATHEMSMTVADVTKNLTETVSEIQEVDSNTVNAADKVNVTITAINTLTGKIDDSAQKIQQLEEDSKDIVAVLDVIMGVAEQTNLLALNAAIEAARAGEHGRGFAVVADEVRNLASRTQEATTQISHVIDKLQSGSQSAVEAMTLSQTEAANAVNQISEAGELVSSVTVAIKRINDMTTNIATATEEQSITSEEISRSIVEINDMTDITSSAAENTLVASENMGQLSDSLQKTVSKLTL